MSEYPVIRGVTSALQDLLRTEITQSTNPDLNGHPIDLRSPKEMREAGGAQGVSLWMYRVERNGYTLNHPPPRPTQGQLGHRPLPVNLYYLVTPIAGAPEDEQLLLGKILQVFNDHATLRGPILSDPAFLPSEEFRLTLEPLTLEELTRVWDALKEPYQLSVSYLVQVVNVDSDLEPGGIAPVARRDLEYVQILEVD